MNRYYAWYGDPGHLEVIHLQLQREFEGFRSKLKKPIIVTEYGADTIPGLHRVIECVFTLPLYVCLTILGYWFDGIVEIVI